MSKVKIIVLLILVILSVVIYFYCSQIRKEVLIPVKEILITVDLAEIDKPLYIKAKNWGITGNHEEIVLSFSSVNITNKERDYIFYTNEVYYKTDKKQTITVYAPESLISEPQNKPLNVKVILVGLKNSNEIKDYSLNYKKYGLEKVTFK